MTYRIKPHLCPSFVKMLQDNFEEEIEVPAAFVKKYKEKMGSTFELESFVFSGRKWTVKMSGDERHLYISQGDWRKFINDHKFKYGDLLIFYLVSEITFFVVIYNSDGCLKTRSSLEKQKSTDSDSSASKEEPTSSRKKKVDSPCNLELGDPKFQLVLKDSDMSRLRIPPAFVKEYNKRLRTKCKLITSNGKRSWSVSLARSDQHYYIRGGEWNNFVTFHGLKSGEILSFFLVDKATFLVVTSGSNCCLKSPPKTPKHIEVLGSSSSESDDHDYPRSRSSARSPKSLKRRAADAYFGSSSKSQKPKDEKYGAYEVGVKEENKSKGEEGSDTESESKGCKSDMEEKVEKVDGFVNLDAENPYFRMILKRHHMSRMNIPRGFARVTGLNQRNNVVLIFQGGCRRIWDAEIRVQKSGRVYICKGWRDFQRGNGLVEGDLCVFKLIKSIGNVIHIEKIHHTP